MYQAKSGVKKFSLYWGGGVPWQKIFFSRVPWQKNFFFQSEHVSSQIWCQKIFPLLGRKVPRKIFFFPVWICIKPNLVSKNFPFTRGGSLDKNFFPVWTCIKPNLVSKNFPFTGAGGGSLNENFFFQSEHVSSQIWCRKIFPFTETGTPPRPRLDQPIQKSETRDPPSPSHPLCPRLDQPIQKSETWDPPPPSPSPSPLPLPPPPSPSPSSPVQGWISLSKNLTPWTPPPPQMLTDRHLWKQYLPVVLRTRAVNHEKWQPAAELWRGSQFVMEPKCRTDYSTQDFVRVFLLSTQHRIGPRCFICNSTQDGAVTTYWPDNTLLNRDVSPIT